MRRADRIAPRRRSAWLFGLAALVVAGAIGAALFGLPVRTWFEQDHQLRGLENEFGELQTVNDNLQSEVDALQTDDGIVRATREELGHIQAGDHRETMLALPPLPRTLPDGWPYSQVDSILSIREAADAAGVPVDGSEPSGDGGSWIEPPSPTLAVPVLSPTTAVTVAPAATATTFAASGATAAASTSTIVVTTTIPAATTPRTTA